LTQTNEEYIGPELAKVFKSIGDGDYGNVEEMTCLLDNLKNGKDNYLVCHDFYSYLEAQ
jgi:glucan phosphorylase